MNKKIKEKYKLKFKKQLSEFVKELQEYVSTEDGQWTIKGFIDVYKNIYTISSDTKIVSKILEIHLFPKILEFAEKNGYVIVLAEKQNWYPDLTFIDIENENIKFALDLKTSYREPLYPGHINGFTLGSHGKYFKERTSTKNIQFPYSEYLGHYVLGIIYTRANFESIDETSVVQVSDIQEKYYSDKATLKLSDRRVVKLNDLHSIVSVIKDFEFFVAEKWQIASDHSGSYNTANIGSITYIEDLKKGNGVFAKLGEEWFDEYWMNYGEATMLKDGKPVKIKKLSDYLEFKGIDKKFLNPMRTKKKIKTSRKK